MKSRIGWQFAQKSKFLFRKETGLITGILVLAITGGVVVFWLNKNPSEKIRQKSINDAIFELTSSAAKYKLINCPEDQDCDGLKEEDEAKWQTDKNNPDTDSDGYLDGEEVISGYHPLVKSPSDKIEPVTKSSRPLPKNLTLAFSSKLSNLIGAGEIPFTGNFDNPGDISQRALDNINTIFDESEINTNLYFLVSENSLNLPDYNTLPREEIKNYFDKLVKILEQKDPRQTKSETEILANLTQDPETDKQIPFVVSTYRQYANNLKTLSPPEKIEQEHIELIKLFASMSRVFEALENPSDDPLKGILAVEKYAEIARRATDILKSWAVKIS